MAIWVMWGLFIVFPEVPKEGERQPSESQGLNKGLSLPAVELSTGP